MQTDLHCRLANRLGYCNRELRKQDCVRPLDGLSDQQVTTNQHPMVGGSMQVGDLVEVVVNDRNKGKQGIIVEYLSTGSVTVYIGTVGWQYPTSFLRLVECSK